jgi:hypothetical protein
MTHEEVFFNFVIKHDILTHLVFGDKPQGQQVIAIIGNDDTAIPYIGDLLKISSNTVIDPNWDEIYESFLNIDHDKESVDYIQSLLESYDINETQTYIDGLVKKMIEMGIVANKVYVRIPPTADKSFYDEVIEA